MKWRHVPTIRILPIWGAAGNPYSRMRNCGGEVPSGSWIRRTGQHMSPQAQPKKLWRKSKRCWSCSNSPPKRSGRFGELLVKRNFWRMLRSCAGIARFVRNAKARTENKGPPKNRRIGGPKSVLGEEVPAWWYATERYQEDRLQINLQLNENRILECQGRVQEARLPDLFPQHVSLYQETCFYMVELGSLRLKFESSTGFCDWGDSQSAS